MAYNVSNSVEKEIVSMQFDHRDFEKNVSQSIDTIRLLQEEIKDLEKASLHFTKLEEASKQVKLDGLLEAADNIEHRFSLLGTFVGRVVENIADQFTGLAMKVAKAGFDMINPFKGWNEGYKKYITQNRAIRTIYNNLADDAKYADMTQSEMFKDIEGRLDYLNTYSDETNAALDKMVEAVSKYTNTGKDIEQASRYVVGYTNMLAASGRTVEEIAYQYDVLDTINSTGRIMTRQYQMIANSFTKTARKLALEYGVEEGNVVKVGEDLYQVVNTQTGELSKALVDTGASFRASLRNGWLTSDIYNRILEDYAAFYDAVYGISQRMGEEFTPTYEWFTQSSTEEIKETLKQLEYTDEEIAYLTDGMANFQKAAMESTRQAQNFTDAINTGLGQIRVGWSNTFRLLFGNILEAEELWTGLANDLYEIFYSIASWRNSIVKEFVELDGMYNIIQGIANVMSNIVNILFAITDGIREVFGRYINASSLASLAKRFADFTEKFLITNQTLKSITNIVKLLLTPLNIIFALGIKIFNLLSPIISALINVLSFVTNIAGKVAEIINNTVISLVESLLDSLLELDFVETTLNAIFDVLGFVFDTIKDIIDVIKLDEIADKIKSIKDNLTELLRPILERYKTILDAISTILKTGIYFALNGIIILVKSIVQGVQFLINKANELGIFNTILTVAKGILFAIAGAIYGIYAAISNLIAFISGNSAKIIGLFTKVKESIESIINKVKGLEAFKKISNSVLNTWTALKNIFNNIKTNFPNIFIGKLDEITNNFTNFISRINAIQDAVNKGILTKQQGFNGITNIIASGIVGAIEGGIKSAVQFLKNIKVDELVMNISNLFATIVVSIGKAIKQLFTDLWKNLNNFINNDEAIQNFANWIQDFVSKWGQKITNTLNNILKLPEIIKAKLQELKAKVLSKMDNEAAKQFLEVFSGIFNALKRIGNVIIKFLEQNTGINIGMIMLAVLFYNLTNAGNVLAKAINKFAGVLDEMRKSLARKSIAIMVTSISGLILSLGILYKILTDKPFDSVAFSNALFALVAIIGMIGIFCTAVVNALNAINLEALNAVARTLLSIGSIFLSIAALIVSINFLNIDDTKAEMLYKLTNFIFQLSIVLTGMSVLVKRFGDSQVLTAMGSIFLGLAGVMAAAAVLTFINPTKLDEVLNIIWGFIFKVGIIAIVISGITLLLARIKKNTKTSKTHLDAIRGGMEGWLQSIAKIISSLYKIILLFSIIGKDTSDRIMSNIRWLFGIIGLLAAEFALIPIVIKNFGGGTASLAVLNTIFNSMKWLIGEVAVIIAIFSFLDVDKIDTVTQSFSLIVGMVGVLGILLAAAGKIVGAGFDVPAFISVLAGVTIILGEVAAIIYLLKDLNNEEILRVGETIALISIAIGALAIMLGLAASFINSGWNIAGALLAIGGVSLFLLEIKMLLETIAGMSDVLNSDAINNFTQFMTTIGIAMAIITVAATALGMAMNSGVGMLIVDGLAVIEVALLGFAMSLDIFGSALIKISEAFINFMTGINSLIITLTTFLPVFSEFVAATDPLKLAEIAGAFILLGPGLVVLSVGVGAISLVLPGFATGLLAASVALEAFTVALNGFFDVAARLKGPIEAGINFVKGFINGITGGKKDAENAAKEMGEATQEGLRESLDEHSPSYLAQIDGEYFVIGFTNGIVTKTPVAKQAAESLGKDVQNGLSEQLSEEEMKKLGGDAIANLAEGMNLDDPLEKEIVINVKFRMMEEGNGEVTSESIGADFSNINTLFKSSQTETRKTIDQIDKLKAKGNDLTETEKNQLANLQRQQNHYQNVALDNLHLLELYRETAEKHGLHFEEETKQVMSFPNPTSKNPIFKTEKTGNWILVNEKGEEVGKEIAGNWFEGLKSGATKYLNGDTEGAVKDIAASLGLDADNIMGDLKDQFNSNFGGKGKGSKSGNDPVPHIDFLPEVQSEIKYLTQVYKDFGKTESDAMNQATLDTWNFYRALLETRLAEDKNFASNMDYETAMVKARDEYRNEMISNMSFNPYGFSSVEATEPRVDYATAKKNIANEKQKIKNFISGFKRLADGGLSAELANIIMQEGYWNSSTFAMLNNMTDDEIRDYQAAIDEVKAYYAEAQETIANTHFRIELNNQKAQQALIKQAQEQTLSAYLTNAKMLGWSEDQIQQGLKDMQAVFLAASQNVNKEASNITSDGKQLNANLNKAYDAAENTVVNTFSTTQKRENDLTNLIDEQTKNSGNLQSSSTITNDVPSITQSSYYKSIKSWVEAADIDTEEKEVKQLMKQAARKKYTYDEVQDLFEGAGYDWVVDEDSDDNEMKEPLYSNKSKASILSEMEKNANDGLTSGGIIYSKQNEGQYEEQGQLIGQATVQGMSNTLQQEGPGMVQTVAQQSEPLVADSLINMLRSVLARPDFMELMYEIGAAISKGISVGIDSGDDDAEDAGESLSSSAIIGASRGAQVNSPSKATMRIGEFIAQGLANGISNNSFLGIDAATEMSNDTINAFSNAFDSINDMVNEEMDNNWNITPVVDLDNVEDSIKVIDKAFSNKNLNMLADAKLSQNEGKNSDNSNSNSSKSNTITFTQNNYSPKSLSRSEIYRQTRNQFSQFANTYKK